VRTLESLETLRLRDDSRAVLRSAQAYYRRLAASKLDRTVLLGAWANRWRATSRTLEHVAVGSDTDWNTRDMGRWRPPQPESSAYITAEGFRCLAAELSDAWSRRRDVVAALTAAAAEGDRSENAEYIYRKRELAGIDRRIRYLQQRLPKLKVVERTGSSTRVVFGAWVCVETEDGTQTEYRLVGADEIGAAKNYVSIDSPLARALIGRQVGDEVSVSLPSGEARYAITGIR